ncbi:MAG: ATP-binding protein [Hyphomicrobiales bacterium]|nr:ATP-binding protein [Hyphomicrobiales bacterium]MBV8428436.1 ATP-binding protein [Hyphomicrobiales bacterium]
MDEALNPYVPGAGTRPPVMAGRDDLVGTATRALKRAKVGLHGKSFIAVGLRGVGKTVVLNKVHELAEDDNYHVLYMEAHDDSSLPSLIVPQLRSILIKLSKAEVAAELGRRGLRVLRNFANALHVKMGEIEVGFDFGEETGTADSGDLANDLPELLQVVGQAAKARNTVLAILIDEMQYLSEKEMGPLVMAIHRTNQRGLPVVLLGAGLPQLLAKMGNSKSYAERLFDFPRVDALSIEDVRAAISTPAASLGVAFDDDAIEAIFEATKGYPYFLQEWGFVSWNSASNDRITRNDVINAGPEAIRRLDESFFRMRLERMTPTERKYIVAMSTLGPGPHLSGEIAKEYGAKVSTVAPLRSSLIAKGMIWSPAYGSTDFTVPLFDEFIRRKFVNPVAFE